MTSCFGSRHFDSPFGLGSSQKGRNGLLCARFVLTAIVECGRFCRRNERCQRCDKKGAPKRSTEREPSHFCSFAELCVSKEISRRLLRSFAVLSRAVSLLSWMLFGNGPLEREDGWVSRPAERESMVIRVHVYKIGLRIGLFCRNRRRVCSFDESSAPRSSTLCFREVNFRTRYPLHKLSFN
jgi:hypothetical protein